MLGWADGCHIRWPGMRFFSIFRILNTQILRLVWVVSETLGWVDGCHIRWPGRGVSLILLRCPSDILLGALVGGPTSYTTNMFSSSCSLKYDSENEIQVKSWDACLIFWGVQYPIHWIYFDHQNIDQEEENQLFDMCAWITNSLCLIVTT